MYITVEEALALPAMSGAILLSGEKGLSRKITSVNIMEVPGISRFVKPEELIITTMYPIRDNVELQEQLIPDLVEKGVSALSIVPLSIEKKIPSVMIKQADEYAFPLIQLPLNTSFNEILNPILIQILERKQIETEYRYRARIIDDLLQGKIVSRPRLISLWKYFGWNLSSYFIPAVLQTEKEDYHESNSAMLQYISGVSEKNSIADTIVADLDDGILMLFPYEKLSKETKQKVREVLGQVSEELQDSWIGIGRDVSDIMRLSDGVFQARMAAKIAQKVPTFGRIVDFENLGVYRILLDLPDMSRNAAIKHAYVEEKLGILVEHDKKKHSEFISTLQALFEHNNNLRQAAKSLFIHYNTMRNRLNQIEDLTKTDLNDPETRLEFQIALKLASIL
ncbi:MAG: Purine catabolism regulatory protein [Firmicutes bacterium ADurb.Bin182]|nr:MAG: Purine catabolism regulatory protein [Firmicutes bacterium ADurb.Bin182]